MNWLEKIAFFRNLIDFIEKVKDVIPFDEIKNLINWDYLQKLVDKSDNKIDDAIVKIIRSLFGVK